MRSVARAVGADPEPLIRVYNTAQPGPPPDADDAAQPGPQPATDDTADPVTVTSKGEWIWRAWLAVVVVAMGGLWFAAFQYLAGPRHAVTAAPSARAHPVAQRLPHHRQAPPAPQTPATPSVPPVTPLVPLTAPPSPPPPPPPAHHPHNARLPPAAHPAMPRHTSWYTTAHFGNLQTGTGLLL